MYNATALLAERLSYIVSMLNKYEKLPSRAPTAGALLGSSVPSNTMEEASKTPGNDLLSMLGGRLHIPHLSIGLLLWPSSKLTLPATPQVLKLSTFPDVPYVLQASRRTQKSRMTGLSPRQACWGPCLVAQLTKRRVTVKTAAVATAVGMAPPRTQASARLELQ